MSPFLKFAILMLIAGTTAGADEPLVVKAMLGLPHAAILPGVPFDLTVTYKNVSQQLVAVGASATVVITPLNGSPIRLRSRAHVDHLDLLQIPNFELRPGETQTGTISWHSNWFYEDAAYTVPGVYDIALELTGDAVDAQKEGLVYTGAVLTPPVRLTRIEPKGEDGEVWRALQQAAGGAWPSHGFGSRATRENMADQVITRHPRSTYYPYAPLLGHAVPAVPLDVAREAVGTFSDSPAYAHLLVTAAVAADAEAAARRQRHAPVEEVERYLRMALEFADAAERSANPAVHAQAQVNGRVLRAELEHLHAGGRQPK
jgi:hypothetical protein